MGDDAYVTRVFLDALAPSIISDFKDTAEALSHCSNYWIPRDIIESGHGATPTELAVTALLDLVSPSLPQDWAGAEYWVQIYESGRGLAFHFDKDEHAMKEKGRMINPIYSSVLYLTGGDEPSSPSFADPGLENGDDIPNTSRVQAPTVVNDQFYDQNTRSTVPEDPTSSTFIFPRENCYCLFDGRLGHGVLDSGCKEERRTLLINWWQVKPENIDRIEICAETKKVEVVTAEVSTPLRDSLPECIYPETIEVTEAELDESGMVFIDDLLAARCKSSFGNGGVHAVTIKHPGLCLYPLDNEQLLEMEEQGEIIQVAACLAPIPDPFSSSSSSSPASASENDNE